MGKATVYCIMYTERCVAQVSTAGECKIYIEDFMPYGLVLKESNDFDSLSHNFGSMDAVIAATAKKKILSGEQVTVVTSDKALKACLSKCDIPIFDIYK